MLLFLQQPICNIINLYTLVTVFGMLCSGDDQLWIGIPNLKKRRYFPFKSLLTGNIITYLNIKFFAAFLCYKVNFYLI